VSVWGVFLSWRICGRELYRANCGTNSAGWVAMQRRWYVLLLTGHFCSWCPLVYGYGCSGCAARLYIWGRLASDQLGVGLSPASGVHAAAQCANGYTCTWACMHVIVCS